MFTIILEKGKRKLGEASLKGNERFLPQEEKKYRLLGELCADDIDVFSSLEMESLVKELEDVAKTLNDIEVTHINEIILLAKECAKNKKYTLTFNPFIK